MNPIPSPSAAVNPSNPDRGEPVAWQSVMERLNAVAPAVEALACHQEQCDMDGVMVMVSRQAVDEVVNAINEIAIDLAARPHPPVSAEREALEKALPFDPSNHHNALLCPYCNPEGLKFARSDAALSSTDGRSSAGQSDKLSNETVARALKAFQEAANSMVMCQRCNGTGYHHGFGEHGHDPDWCVVCGGCQSVAEFDDEGAMRKALEAVGACSIPVECDNTPRLTDNDEGEITVALAGKELRGWSYASDDERRAKMLAAREYVEGFCDGRAA